MSGPEVKYSEDSNLFKTLVLLRLYECDGSPVFFIVEGLADSTDENALDQSYMYDEHTCPTNYMPVHAVYTPTDDDPHGVFEYVRSVWMPAAFDGEAANPSDDDEILRALFPETFGTKEIDGELSPAKLLELKRDS